MTNNIFDALGLKKNVLKAIKNLGYEKPTPVQAELIPVALNGRDILACAQTGSGKTAAYTIPIFAYLCEHENKNALIIAPTRELAQQIQAVFKQLAQGTEINTALITGGKNMQGQLRKLKSGARVIIGTPGRLNDHLKRKSLILDSTAITVWDETDRMLDLGFAEQIEDIVAHLPREKQTLMLSATFPPKVIKLAQNYLNNPVKIIIGILNNPAENVEQKTIKIEGNEKLKKLTEILSGAKGQYLVFVKTQRTAAEITRYLKKNLFDAAALHGGLKQKDRDSAVKGFRENGFKIMIATDVAARGLDIPSIETVINYELPQNPEEYIHRLGRTGRYDKTGICINLIARADRAQWKEIKTFMEKSSKQAQQALENSSFENKQQKENTPLPQVKEQPIRKNENIKQVARLKQNNSSTENNKVKEEKSQTPKTQIKQKDILPANDVQKQKTNSEPYVFTPFKKVYVGKVKQQPKPKQKTIPHNGRKDFNKRNKHR